MNTQKNTGTAALKGFEGDKLARYMRPPAAAKYCCVSLRQFQEWMRRGLVPYRKISHKVVLILREELDEALERFKVNSIGGAK